MTDRAVAAYCRWFNHYALPGEVFQQPNRYDTEREGNTITVANAYTTLARYRVYSKGGVEFLRKID